MSGTVKVKGTEKKVIYNLLFQIAYKGCGYSLLVYYLPYLA